MLVLVIVSRFIILLLSFLVLISSAAWAEELSLVTFLVKVKNQNLDLKIEDTKVDGAAAKAGGLKIPPPMLGVTQLNEQTGDTATGFEINQTIPFPTKILADSSARKFEANGQEQTQVARENEILATAKLLYFDLWASQEKLTLLLEKKNILEEHIKLSRSTARSDSYASIHLIKAESDLDLLENDILSAEQNLRAKQLEVATVINIDPVTFRPKLIEPSISKIPSIDSLALAPQIRSMEYSLESLKAREREAKSSWFPDISLRYREMGNTSMSSSYNEIMVAVTLPFVFFGEANSVSHQASAQRSQAEYELEKQKRNLESEKILLLTKAESIKKQLETFSESIIPRAKKRIKLVHNLAPRDMETLQDHREASEALPVLKMKALELRLEYEATIATMEKYLSQKGQQHDIHK